MKKNFKILVLFILVMNSFALNAQKFEELALTPPMGWNSWNKFGCNVNEKMIREIADKIVETGLRDAGYIYINIDDCWHGARDSQGFINADPENFPSGMKALADYVHSKGLKLGIYSDAGRMTCAGKPGSAGHEYQDALTYAKWGIDYLKYDWCYTQDVNPVGAYMLMRDALHNAGRPIVFSLCEWGSSKPWIWAKETGHLWRTTGDITCCFDCPKENGNGVLQILDMQEGLREYAGPGHWNDPDMLEVGNGMTVNQDRAHFSMWCMLSAPLLLGNDVRTMNPETKDILMNKEVIAIDQDSLGISAIKIKSENGLEMWFKPLTNDSWAFCILNRTTEPKKYSIHWQQFNFEDKLSKKSTNFYNTIYSIRNLWTKSNEGTTKKDKEVIIPAQDVVMYKLDKIKK